MDQFQFTPGFCLCEQVRVSIGDMAGSGSFTVVRNEVQPSDDTWTTLLTARDAAVKLPGMRVGRVKIEIWPSGCDCKVQGIRIFRAASPAKSPVKSPSGTPAIVESVVNDEELYLKQSHLNQISVERKSQDSEENDESPLLLPRGALFRVVEAASGLCSLNSSLPNCWPLSPRTDLGLDVVTIERQLVEFGAALYIQQAWRSFLVSTRETRHQRLRREQTLYATARRWGASRRRALLTKLDRLYQQEVIAWRERVTFGRRVFAGSFREVPAGLHPPTPNRLEFIN